MNNDRKNLMYGLVFVPGDPVGPPVTEDQWIVRPLAMDDGSLPGGIARSNLYLQGQRIFSIGGFNSYGIPTGLFDFVPVTASNFMLGQSTGDTDFYQSAMCRDSILTQGNPQNSLMVSEVQGAWAFDRPAADDTEATITFGVGVGNFGRLQKIIVTINAVAAIAAPILVTVEEGASPVLEIPVTVPAGQTFCQEFELGILFEETCTVTVAAPGATNFAAVAGQSFSYTEDPFSGNDGG